MSHSALVTPPWFGRARSDLTTGCDLAGGVHCCGGSHGLSTHIWLIIPREFQHCRETDAPRGRWPRGVSRCLAACLALRLRTRIALLCQPAMRCGPGQRSQDQLALHRTREAGAEWLCGVIQRSDARRAAERARIAKHRPCPYRDRCLSRDCREERPPAAPRHVTPAASAAALNQPWPAPLRPSGSAPQAIASTTPLCIDCALPLILAVGNQGVRAIAECQNASPVHWPSEALAWLFTSCRLLQ